MFYTLLKFLVWGLLLAFVGGVIGWVLRSLKARGDSTWRSSADLDEVDEMRDRLARFDAVVAERDQLREQVAHVRDADAPGDVDDLTAIDGIGPKIAVLCAGIGVSTWAQLACTDQATLRSMLDDAGAPYSSRDPSSWPRQAGALAAEGRDDPTTLTADDR